MTINAQLFYFHSDSFSLLLLETLEDVKRGFIDSSKNQLLELTAILKYELIAKLKL